MQYSTWSGLAGSLSVAGTTSSSGRGDLHFPGMLACYLLHGSFACGHLQNLVHNLLYETLTSKLSRKLVTYNLGGNLIHIGIQFWVTFILEPMNHCWLDFPIPVEG